MTQEEIFEYQDRMVGFVIKAKELQKETGFLVGLAMNGSTLLVPVDSILKSLANMSEREDLLEKIHEALGK